MNKIKQIYYKIICSTKSLTVRNLFYNKTLIWTKYVRIFCDAGKPWYYKYPKFRKINYNPYWKLTGFIILWLGREFWFSFGEDVNGLYENKK